MRAKADASTLSSLLQLLDASLVARLKVRCTTRRQRVARMLTRRHTLVHLLKAAIKGVVFGLLIQGVNLPSDVSQVGRSVHAIVVELDHWRLVHRRLLMLAVIHAAVVEGHVRHLVSSQVLRALLIVKRVVRGAIARSRREGTRGPQRATLTTAAFTRRI